MATGGSVVSEYHRRAEECRLQAEKAKSEDDKARWQKRAERWEYIAADAERQRKDRSTEKPPSGSSVTLVPRHTAAIQSGRSPDLLDHLVGAQQQRSRHFDAECLGGLEVHHQLEFGRL